MDYLPTWPLEFNTLVLFGVLLLAGAIGGYLAHRRPWLPSITGFMLVGFALGPSVLNILTIDALQNARIIIDVALGLILYRLGTSLDVASVLRNPYLLTASILESALTFLLVFFLLRAFDFQASESALIAAICISSSPAVLLHVAHEMGARGKVTDSAEAMVALNNVWAFVAYSAVLPFMHVDANAPWHTVIFQPLYRLLGSVALAAAVAWLLLQLARRLDKAHQYHLALVIGAIMLALGLAHTFNVSTLFALLVLGILIRTQVSNESFTRIHFGEAFELFFIVLFVFAGANLHIAELVHMLPVAVALVAVRSIAKWSGPFVVASVFRLPKRQAVSTGLLLIPMAGLAIGLVQATGVLFPENGEKIAALVLGAVAIFETLGPPVAGWAFRIAGEAHASELAEDVESRKDIVTQDAGNIDNGSRDK
ncbi:MAG: cation:proton antiporter [Gammaproteobacteria bacterium]|nr:cation:proton antiporter [Gammaproteobacteria bacterium]